MTDDPHLRSFVRRAALAVSLSAGLTAPAHAAPRSVSAPLADAELFISPCGKPFRSKPGEPYPVVAWFQETDQNHDGRIDREEFRTAAESFFHTLDLNGDDLIDDHEVSIYERQVVPEISAGVQSSELRSGLGGARLILAQIGGGRGGGAGAGQIDPGGASAGGDPEKVPKQSESDGPPQGAAPYELINDPEPVRSADRKLAGRISLADFLARADQNFAVLDPGERGYFTLADLPPTPVQSVARPARGR